MVLEWYTFGKEGYSKSPILFKTTIRIIDTNSIVIYTRRTWSSLAL